MPNNATIGMRIRSHRQRLKMTLDELAEATGFSKSYISQIENGKINITVSLLKKLSLVLNVTLPEIIDGDSSKDIYQIKQADRKWIYVEDSVSARQALIFDDQNSFSVWTMVLDPYTRVKNSILHSGEELTLVLRGKVNVHINEEEVYELNKGDMLFYSSEGFHTWSNSTDTQAEILIVGTPI